MPHYHWKGIQGTQYASGDLEALTEDEAAYKLTQQGIIITGLQITAGEKSAPKAQKKAARARRKKVPEQVVLAFTRKLSAMLKAGLPILQTMEMVLNQTEDKYFKEVIQGLYTKIESGTALSSAFAEHPEIFDSVYINLLKAGEASGKLDIFLQKLVVGLEKNIRIKSAIKRALMYPAILMSVAVGVLGIMMIYVVPVFTGIFGNTGVALPGPTQLIIHISDFLRNPLGGGVLVLGVVAGSFGIKFALRSNINLRRRWHAYQLKMPLFGNLIQKSALSRIAMVQGNLSAAGVSVLETLDIASTTTNNLVVSEAIEAVKRGVFSGDPLSQLLRKHSVFPQTYADMVEVGEKTGNMQEMLSVINNYYEEEFDGEVEKLSTLMEPVIIVFLGVTIGFILVAMYMPIFKMGQAVTG